MAGFSLDSMSLPCNVDMKPDFLQMLRKTKATKLYTNGRMFYYKDFCDEVSKYVDEFNVLYYSSDANVQNRLSGADVNRQVKVGLDNLLASGKKVRILLVVGKENMEGLCVTIRSLPEIPIDVRVIEPHPIVFRELSKAQYDNVNVKVVPKEVKFEVTSKCNLDCGFCYNKNSMDKSKKDMNTQKVLKAIDNIADAGVKRLRITGGEPFMREDIFKILTHAKIRGLFVIVNTNLTLLSQQMIGRMKNKVDRVLVSINNIEDFDLKKQLIINLTENVEVEVSTIATSHTIHDIERYFLKARELGVYWFLLRAVPTKNNSEPLTQEDIPLLIKSLDRIEKRFRVNVKIESLPFCSYEPEKVRKYSTGSVNCGIINKIVIDPSGIVKPCYSIKEELGKMTDDLLEIYSKGFPEEMRTLKMLPKVCRDCRYVDECIGGCRWAAKLATGKYNGMDPLARPERYAI